MNEIKNNSFSTCSQWGQKKLRAPDSSGNADHDEVERCLVGWLAPGMILETRQRVRGGETNRRGFPSCMGKILPFLPHHHHF